MTHSLEHPQLGLQKILGLGTFLILSTFDVSQCLLQMFCKIVCALFRDHYFHLWNSDSLIVSIELGVPASEDAASLASEHQNARKLRNKLGLDPAIDAISINSINVAYSHLCKMLKIQ